MTDKLNNHNDVNHDLENLVLGEEPDTRLEQGMLSFNETPGARSEASAHIKSWSKVKRGIVDNHDPVEENVVEDNTDFVNPVLKFEIVSARTVEKENEKKHVAYTLLIRKDGVKPDPNPAVIERRYTDFLELYDGLRRIFPALMGKINFPRKVLTGNLDPSLISARSSGFEALLEHVARDRQLRESAALMTFLQNREEAEARQWMQAEQYDQAVPLLENIFRLLNKLYTDSTFAVNVTPIINVSQVVVEGMIQRKSGGSIVNISPQASQAALLNHTVYCASKAAVDQITKVMAVELGPHNIRVNTANPTVVLTEMGRFAWRDPERASKMMAEIPLGKFAEVEDIVNAVLFLLSDKAAMVNGIILPVDGGFLAK